MCPVHRRVDATADHAVFSDAAALQQDELGKVHPLATTTIMPSIGRSVLDANLPIISRLRTWIAPRRPELRHSIRVMRTLASLEAHPESLPVSTPAVTAVSTWRLWTPARSLWPLARRDDQNPASRQINPVDSCEHTNS
jgi:hypothetical protein